MEDTNKTGTGAQSPDELLEFPMPEGTPDHEISEAAKAHIKVDMVRVPLAQAAPKEEQKPEIAAFLKQVHDLPETYTVISLATKHPYVICDAESFHDQVMLYGKKEDAEEKANSLWEQKNRVAVAKVEQKAFPGFCMSLPNLGVDSILYKETAPEGEYADMREISLDTILRMPDFSALPENQRPVTNPALQLSGIYFMQEYRREVSRAKKPRLAELEEEAISALSKSRLLMPVHKADGKSNIPYIKNENGDMFQPFFTDLAEMRKFDKQGQLHALAIPFTEIGKALIPEVKGLVLNPQGICMALNSDKVKELTVKDL